MTKRVTAVVLATLLFVVVAQAAPNPLLGTWTMKEKIGSSWFTDRIIVTSVSPQGSIVGHDNYGDRVSGWTYAGVAFITKVNDNSYLDAYYFCIAKPALFAHHLGTGLQAHALQTQWHPLIATKSKACPEPTMDKNSVQLAKIAAEEH